MPIRPVQICFSSFSICLTCMYVDVDQFLVAVKKKLFDVFKVYEKSYLKFKLILPKQFFRPKKFFDMAGLHRHKFLCYTEVQSLTYNNSYRFLS